MLQRSLRIGHQHATELRDAMRDDMEITATVVDSAMLEW